jgi:glutamate racemase
MKIGVFDSGIGGLSVANAIKKEMPTAEVLFLNDSKNVPYGSKTPEQLQALVVPIFRQFEAANCDAVVIACNTVSTILAPQLRELFRFPIVALEPMVKPAAALTKTGVIAVCATPATLGSERYHWLKKEFATGATVLEPDCSDWAKMIETSSVDQDKIAATVVSMIEQKADVIVLGCTHYHWIEEEIKQIVDDRAAVLLPEQPVITQLKRVLLLPS